MAKKNLNGLSDNQRYEEVYTFVQEQVRPVQTGNIPITARFSEDLGMSNLDMAFLLYDLELEFGIALPDSLMDDVTTVGELIDLTLKTAKNCL